jgi:hypothetical protein
MLRRFSERLLMVAAEVAAVRGPASRSRWYRQILSHNGTMSVHCYFPNIRANNRNCSNWQWLWNATLDARFTQPGNDKRRTPLHGRPSNREELRDEVIGSVGLFHKIDCDTPPSSKRTEHPEVARNFDARCDAAVKPVA